MTQDIYEALHQLPQTYYAYAIDEDQGCIYVGTMYWQQQNEIAQYEYSIKKNTLNKRFERDVPFAISQIIISTDHIVFAAGNSVLAFDADLNAITYEFSNDNIEIVKQNEQIFGFNPFPIVGFDVCNKVMTALSEQHILRRRLDILDERSMIVPLYGCNYNMCAFEVARIDGEEVLLLFYRTNDVLDEQKTGVFAIMFNSAPTFIAITGPNKAVADECEIPGAFLEVQAARGGASEFNVLTSKCVAQVSVVRKNKQLKLQLQVEEQFDYQDLEALSILDDVRVVSTHEFAVYKQDKLIATFPAKGYATRLVKSGDQIAFFSIGVAVNFYRVDIPRVE